MPQLRLALAQLDLTVGDIPGNLAQIESWAAQAHKRGAHVAAFPEMAVTGYPIEDLALRTSFVDAAADAVPALARRLDDDGLGDLIVVVGYLERPGLGPTSGTVAKLPSNAVAVLHHGKVATRQAKHYLPNYGVFDEFRYFQPGNTLNVIRVHGIDIALAICEDLWQEGGPVAAAREVGAGLLLTVNASPYEANKDDQRGDIVARRAREAGCTLAYVNQVGGQDELVFDGDSMVANPDGSILARAPQFVTGGLMVDLELPAAGRTNLPTSASAMAVDHTVLAADLVATYKPQPPRIAEPLSNEAEIYTAIVTGLRDYVTKNGFSSVLLGLSGGIDSALVAAIACDAVGHDHVYGVSMPSRYSSDHSKDDASELASRCGLNYRVVPIQPMVQPFLDTLGLTGVAEENLQARIRGVILMGLSNEHGHLVLATGNKSELAVGYSTLYGDAVGGFAPIKDVPKTMVWELAKWRNADAARRGERPPIPRSSIEKPPSAELRPGQVDSDSLPDYDTLDAVLDDYVEGDLGPAELVSKGFDPALVDRIVRLVDHAEYKRRQYPPGPKITPKAFGRDRRLPISNGWREDNAAPTAPDSKQR